MFKVGIDIFELSAVRCPALPVPSMHCRSLASDSICTRSLCKQEIIGDVSLEGRKTLCHCMFCRGKVELK